MLLFSDYSVQGGGFTVGTVEHMVSPESKARFPGQWYDKDTEVTDSGGNVLYAGLSYNWHRFYDANVGRYITPDPIGLAGGMNVYSYVGGNPANATDFMGLYTSLHSKESLLLMGLLFGTAAVGMTQTPGCKQLNKEIIYRTIDKIKNQPKSWCNLKGMDPKDPMFVLGCSGSTSRRDGGRGKWKKGGVDDGPALDSTGKVHGDLPKISGLKNMSREELEILLSELRISVQTRIKKQ